MCHFECGQNERSEFREYFIIFKENPSVFEKSQELYAV